MTENPETDQTRELLKKRLAEQDELRAKFEAATPADELKEEINLGESYIPVTEFRMDRTTFLVKHTPTELLNQWSVMTGPGSLKNGVEGWVDAITTTLAPKQQNGE
jgi:hypothetical protein